MFRYLYDALKYVRHLPDVCSVKSHYLAPRTVPYLSEGLHVALSILTLSDLILQSAKTDKRCEKRPLIFFSQSHSRNPF